LHGFHNARIGGGGGLIVHVDAVFHAARAHPIACPFCLSYRPSGDDRQWRD
jgi:hypothetical protein